MKAVKEKNILVVDDEETVRESLASVLEREGYRLFLAESGDEGLRLLKETPGIQLVAALRRQMNFLKDLERDFPYLAALTRDEDAQLLLAEADLVHSSGS